MSHRTPEWPDYFVSAQGLARALLQELGRGGLTRVVGAQFLEAGSGRAGTVRAKS